jgi:hypothetical protein
MRAVHGKLLISGIPRMTRPRLRNDRFTGFTVVDPGGNWIRINKAAQLVAGLPHTILRATQFHDLVHKVLAGAVKLPVMPLPTMSFQPVDVGDVATQLVELDQGEFRSGCPAERSTPCGTAPSWPHRTTRRALSRSPSTWPRRAFDDPRGPDLPGVGPGRGGPRPAAAIWPERRLVQVALTANLTFTVPHFVYHATHVAHYPTGSAIGLIVTLGVAVLLPAALLVPSRRLPRATIEKVR